MTPEAQNPLHPESNKTVENRELEDFFQRLPSNLRWPKPNDEAVAAAVEAIQRLSGGIAGAETAAGRVADPGTSCSGCGSALAAGARFCPQCGMARAASIVAPEPIAPARDGGVHHYHHHYHHFVQGTASGSGALAAEAEAVAPRGRVPGSPGTSTGGRAEAMARQVAQDWAQASNTRHLDDLVELYAADATLIRSSVPPVRSLPAVREFLHAILEAGLGEVEMESLRTEVMGEIAMDLGRCKMLVPVAMGKRREERGKYLLILVRQPAGTWKILADCWSSDQIISSPPAAEAARKPIDPGLPVRKPR